MENFMIAAICACICAFLWYRLETSNMDVPPNAEKWQPDNPNELVIVFEDERDVQQDKGAFKA